MNLTRYGLPSAAVVKKYLITESDFNLQSQQLLYIFRFHIYSITWFIVVAC